MANPRQVREFYAGALERLPGVELTAHFHNTRGQGLANALVALESGVESFESSFAELGLSGAARLDGEHRHRGPDLDVSRDGRADGR
jgi:isopropylmalate/homocitrate/citramalate synthase